MKNTTITKVLAVLAIAVSLVPFSVKGATLQEIQNQLNLLNNQLAQLQGTGFSQGTPAACISITFTRNLQRGSAGQDVVCLQSVLNRDAQTQVAVSGSGSPGRETSIFGMATRSAVIKFQAKYGILQTGTVGPVTRAKLNALLSSFKTTAVNPVQNPAPVATAPTVAPPLSQSDMTVAAIGKAAPAVISIVITKQVPEYQVVYQDPFGNGLFQVPTYQPTGRMVEQRLGAGTGFLVSPNGYIVTNKHVVFDDQATYTATLASGVQQPIRIIQKDAQNDIAVVKIEGSGYPAISLGDSASLQLGQPIIAIGNALGQFSNSVSLGIVSGLNRTINASDSTGNVETLTGVIQTDAAINPGNSGGPLLDLQARVVGVNVATVQGSSNISFAIPIDAVKNLIKSAAGI
ncbi:trypsin-like peptidase domain-containing protein [Candidatus Parcubacteria bacterium]|nr:trypsin-like peptidase domain-containing protein [Candidatus Parcubacteria bacterium]